MCCLKFSWPIPLTPIVEATAGLVSGFSHHLDMNVNPGIGTKWKYSTVCRVCCSFYMICVFRHSLWEETVSKHQHPRKWFPEASCCLRRTLPGHVLCSSKMYLLLFWKVSACVWQVSTQTELLCTFIELFISYHRRTFSCHLKHNPNEMVVNAKDGVTSGLPSRFCQPDNSMYLQPARHWEKRLPVNRDLGSKVLEVLHAAV